MSQGMGQLECCDLRHGDSRNNGGVLREIKLDVYEKTERVLDSDVLASVVFLSTFYSKSLCTAQAGLELRTLPSQPPKYLRTQHLALWPTMRDPQMLNTKQPRDSGRMSYRVRTQAAACRMFHNEN